MSHQRKILLAGIAALALVAGTGLASAQDASKDQATQQQATQQMNKGTTAGKTIGKTAGKTTGKTTGKTATRENRRVGTIAEHGKTNAGQFAQERHRTAPRHTAQYQHQMNARYTAESMRHGRMAEQGYRHGRGANATAQRERTGMEGLQGNATGMHAQLTEQQRTQVRDTVINARGAPRANNVTFDVIAGTIIRRGAVSVVPVPPTLVRIDPAWRGMRYFVFQNEVVIVNPRGMRIVAVVPA
jgi:Protein of unknown function (DUF1236)